MNSHDSHFSIGYSHTVCQDYSISGIDVISCNNLIYAIAADGCSASKFSDIGARLFSHVVKNNLNLFSSRELIENIYCVAKIVKESREFMNLPDEFMDCSIVLCNFVNNKFKVNIFGDGGFYVKFKDKRFEYYFVDFDQNAPFYMSYLINKTQGNYYYVFPDQRITLRKVWGIEGNDNVNNSSEDLTSLKGIDLFNRLGFEFNDVSFVSVFSDGVKSFSKQLENEVITLSDFDIVKQFTAYKNFNGEFVQRRMNKLNKDFVKDRISHFDDISVATIYNG